jgi:hypothetical protein
MIERAWRVSEEAGPGLVRVDVRLGPAVPPSLFLPAPRTDALLLLRETGSGRETSTTPRDECRLMPRAVGVRPSGERLCARSFASASLVLRVSAGTSPWPVSEARMRRVMLRPRGVLSGAPA